MCVFPYLNVEAPNFILSVWSNTRFYNGGVGVSVAQLQLYFKWFYYLNIIICCWNLDNVSSIHLFRGGGFHTKIEPLHW